MPFYSSEKRREPRYTTISRLVPIIISALVSIVLPLCIAWQLRGEMTSGHSDFAAFYTAAKIITSGHGHQLYDRDTQANTETAYTLMSGHPTFIGYVHAPFEALLFVPVSYLPYPTAVWVWWFVDLMLAYLSLYLLLPFIPNVDARLAFALLALGIYFPLWIAECQGQDSVLTLLLLVLCFATLLREQYWRAGAILALSTYKPPLAIPMLVMLALTSKRRVPLLAGFAVTCVLLFCLSVATVGWAGVASYPGYLASFAAGANEQYHIETMPNIRGLMFSTIGSHVTPHQFIAVVNIVSMILLAVAVGCVYRARVSLKEEPIRYSLFVITVALVAYHEYSHDLTIVLLPLFVIWDRLAGNGARTINHKLLAATVLILFCASVVTIPMPQIFTCMMILFFALLCRELFATQKLLQISPSSGVVHQE